MTVAIQQPQQREDALSKLARGLQIAQSIYGIKTSMAALDDHDQKQKDLAEEKNRLARGESTQQEVFEMSKTHDLQATTPDDPSALHRYVVSDGKRSDFLAVPKKQSGLTFDQQMALKTAEHPKQPTFKSTGMLDDQGRLLLADDQGNVKPGPVAQKPGADKEREPKPNQYQAATYGRRLEAAEQVFDGLQKDGFDRTSKAQGVLSYLPGFAQPGQIKQQEQAERNFVNALLRRESGSAISSAEFDSAEKQYFPRAGDTPEVLAQKVQNRGIALEGLRAESGTAWTQVGQIGLQVPKKKGDSSGSAIAAPAAKPKTVIQNGHTYILNEKTGKYE